MEQIIVTKASGEQEAFSEEKLRQSLTKAGAPHDLAERIVAHILREIEDGMSTAFIYKHAYTLLRKHTRHFAAKYNLKRAIMALGPTGHPFEHFIGELFAAQGFQAEVATMVPGACVMHEVDVVAQKDNRHLMVECKFHHQLGIRSDIKVALYVQARFEDIHKQWLKSPALASKNHEGWLATNTRLSSDAVQYAKCVGLHVIAWDFPTETSLQRIIENHCLYPITCLTTLSTAQRQTLLQRNVLMCRDLWDNRDLLGQIGIAEARQKQVLDEVGGLCRT